MAEQVTINIVPGEVGVQYHPETPEATIRNELFAFELGANALAKRAIIIRVRNNVPVPPALLAFAEALTFESVP